MGRIKKFIPLILLSLIPTLLIWLPFYLRVKSFWTIPLPQQGMATIVANFDGPLYLAVAKTFYDPQSLGANYQFPLSHEYYSAHFPLFPMLIKVFSPILGHPYSMLFVTLISSIMALYFFYIHSREYLSKENALFLTSVFSIFPARWLIVRSVGSPEPLFVALILASVYYFRKEKYLLAGIAGFFAQMTKSPAILLFFAYLIQIIIPHIKDLKKIEFKKYLPLLLIPVGLLVVFTIYAVRYGDFFTYFKSGDNIHLFFPPFQIFNYSASWVGTFWLEEVIFIYAIGVLGIYKLYQEKMTMYFYFTLTFFVSLLFVAHRDLLRYALPIVPFLLIAFREILIKKEFKIVLAVIIIPIYLYSLAFISQNAMPIANWNPFL
ncbi:MAG TPA: hypothetical protein VI795_02805 [Patescibacteria group bacterium]|nr:hypothetical protein [Patescibacteria group bacterium]